MVSKLNMILLFLGSPRTATTSLFNALSKHEDITVSIQKEIMNYENKKLLESNYLDYFKPPHTNVILDGTPNTYKYHSDIVKKIVKKFGFNVKIIYPVRNPFDRIYSMIKQNIVVWDDWKYPLIQCPFGDINLKELNRYLFIHRDSENLKHAYSHTNDVFIFRLDQLNMNDIFNFIGVEPIDIKMGKHNGMRVWDEEPYENHKRIVDEHWAENFKSIAEAILDDLNKIKHRVYVQDWIEEAEMIIRDNE